MSKLTRMTEAEATEKGMSCEHDPNSKTTACPACKCTWYGNKNLCGDGHRVCLECYQDYYINTDYKS